MRPVRAAAVAACLALVAAACAELRQPPPPPPPAGLVGLSQDPLGTALAAATAAFADRGIALAGQPAAAAEAVANLEYVAATLPADPRYRRLAGGPGRDLALAREEVRDALGVDPDAPADAVIRSLLAAAAALRVGDSAAAARALPAPPFRPGGAASVARLGTLGPLPQAMVATSVATQGVAWLDAAGGPGGGAQWQETNIGLGSVTTRFGGAGTGGQ